MFGGKDILAAYDGPGRGGGAGGGGGGGSGGSGDGFWPRWNDGDAWRRGSADVALACLAFAKEVGSTGAALSLFLAAVWGIGNIPTVARLVQLLVVKALRLDGGSKRSRLEKKVKAAVEGGAAGSSKGVAESTVMAQWADEDEEDDEDD